MGGRLQRLRCANWRALVVAVATMAIIVVASIGVVRYRNRDRAVTNAIVWAADDLALIPDSVITRVFPLERFKQERQRFCDAMREGALPVDSVRAFYLAYALWARDGVFSPDELIQFGAYLGLKPDSSAMVLPGERR